MEGYLVENRLTYPEGNCKTGIGTNSTYGGEKEHWLSIHLPYDRLTTLTIGIVAALNSRW